MTMKVYVVWWVVLLIVEYNIFFVEYNIFSTTKDYISYSDFQFRTFWFPNSISESHTSNTQTEKQFSIVVQIKQLNSKLKSY